ncbi:MAG TPA: PAS domain S-box protein [Acidobacteriaceae bacterium]|nr:PAS domain S-box protein [Acidobacteriaceae bacterium]
MPADCYRPMTQLPTPPDFNARTSATPGAKLDFSTSESQAVFPASRGTQVSARSHDIASEAERQRAAPAQAPESATRRPEALPRGPEPELLPFLEDAVLGMHWMALDGTILWANRSELELLGYDAQEFTGRNFVDFAETPETMRGVLQRLAARESIHNCELRLRVSDGSMRWVRIDASPWPPQGEVEHARCFVVDVSEKRIADEASMKLAAIVESCEDAIVSKNLNGIVTSWNAAAERILGYRADEIIGKPILTLIPPELHKDEAEILRKIQAGERIAHFETVRVTKSGERLDVSLTISPVRDREGNIVGAAKILRDVTMQKKMEAALRTTERLASVGRLAATVAHEINNPLEAVTNLIYLARRNPELPEGALSLLVMADEELQRVTHIARQTLGFYRDTSAPIVIPVPEAIDEMLAIYHRRLTYKQVSLHKRVQPGLRVCALHGQFKQIVSNLVTNAIDAVRPGGRIEVRARESRHPVTGAPGIRLVVADQGCGIPDPIRRQIFTPFFTTKKDVGTGLGLWIVKGMLLKSGGTIFCRSRVARDANRDSGTVMMVFLPSDSSTQAEQAAA